MKVIVFGATGATGRLVVDAAVAANHLVTAFVRDANRVATAQRERITVVEGDAMNLEAVAQALPGHDAVVCALGTMPEAKEDRNRRQPGIPVCSTGTKNILTAMAACGCKRIVVESSTSVGESLSTGSLFAGRIVRLVLKNVMEDKELQEASVKASNCNWTILRPVKLNNAPAKGNLQSGPDLRWSLASGATRADVANFMVKILGESSTYRQAMTLKN